MFDTSSITYTCGCVKKFLSASSASPLFARVGAPCSMALIPGPTTQFALMDAPDDTASPSWVRSDHPPFALAPPASPQASLFGLPQQSAQEKQAPMQQMRKSARVKAKAKVALAKAPPMTLSAFFKKVEVENTSQEPSQQTPTEVPGKGEGAKDNAEVEAGANEVQPEVAPATSAAHQGTEEVAAQRQQQETKKTKKARAPKRKHRKLSHNEEKKDEPAAEEKKDETAAEEKKDETAAEEKKDETAAEDQARNIHPSTPNNNTMEA